MRKAKSTKFESRKAEVLVLAPYAEQLLATHISSQISFCHLSVGNNSEPCPAYSLLLCIYEHQMQRPCQWQRILYSNVNWYSHPLQSKSQDLVLGFHSGSVVKNLPASVGGMGLIPGERNGNPLQYSCLENSMNRGAWRATVHGVAKSWTWFKDWTTTIWDCLNVIFFKPSWNWGTFSHGSSWYCLYLGHGMGRGDHSFSSMTLLYLWSIWVWWERQQSDQAKALVRMLDFLGECQFCRLLGWFLKEVCYLCWQHRMPTLCTFPGKQTWIVCCWLLWRAQCKK